MNDGELEARMARLLQKLLRSRPSENYYVGYGRVAEPFPNRTREGTSAGAAPVATIDGVVASGDLSGTYPDPTVDGIQGRAVASTAPANAEVLAYSTANTQWEPTDITSTVSNLGFTKELLMQDGVTNPPVPIETEAQDDWLYED